MGKSFYSGLVDMAISQYYYFLLFATKLYMGSIITQKIITVFNTDQIGRNPMKIICRHHPPCLYIVNGNFNSSGDYQSRKSELKIHKIRLDNDWLVTSAQFYLNEAL
jgi:hypothetical protein